MSFKKSVPPLNIDLAPSKVLLVILLVMYMGAAGLTIFCIAQWYLVAPLLALLAGSVVLNLCRLGWMEVCCKNTRLGRWHSTEKLTWLDGNSWKLFLKAGKAVQAQLLGSSTCLPYFAALNFKIDGNNWLNRHRSVVISPDAIDKEIFRQLRVHLRTRPLEDQDS